MTLSIKEKFSRLNDHIYAKVVMRPTTKSQGFRGVIIPLPNPPPPHW